MTWKCLALWIALLGWATANADPVREPALINAARAACKTLSTLTGPSFFRSNAYFSRPDGIIAVVIQGTKPAPSMKGQVGAELCLYFPQRRQAQITEWDELAKPGSKPPISRPADF